MSDDQISRNVRACEVCKARENDEDRAVLVWWWKLLVCLRCWCVAMETGDE